MCGITGVRERRDRFDQKPGFAWQPNATIVIMGKMMYSTFSFNPIFVKLAGNKNRDTISVHFEICLDRTRHLLSTEKNPIDILMDKMLSLR